MAGNLEPESVEDDERQAVTMTRGQLNRAVAAARAQGATEAINKCFAIFGVNIQNEASVQAMHDDFALLRALRIGKSKAVGVVSMTILTLVTGAIVLALYNGFLQMLNDGHPPMPK